MTLFGEPVGRVDYYGALNDAGQIAFAYGRYPNIGSNMSIAVATPVPEPIAVPVTAAGLWLLRRPRRR